MNALAENQTPEPNLLGYLVLIGFAGAALWAFTRPKMARAAAPSCPQVTPERLQLFNAAFDVSVVHFPSASTPPRARVAPDGRIFFPESTDQRTLAPPVVVVIAGDQFWRYEEGDSGDDPLARPAPTDRENFCKMGS